MPLERFIPKSPDPFIRNSQDFEVAKFGHLNTIIEYVNTYVAADSLQLSGTGPLTSTARYITDSLGNTSTLAISTVNIGVGTTAPQAKLDVRTTDGFGSVQTYFNNASSAPLRLLRANNGVVSINTLSSGGTIDLPTDRTILGGITRFTGNAYVDGDYRALARMEYFLDAIPTAGVAPCSIRFLTVPASSSTYSLDERMGITSDGNVQINDSIVNNRNAKLFIKGSGSTSATTSLLVQNSAATQILKVQDDGQVFVNQGNQQITFAGAGGISRIQAPNEMTIGLGASFNAMKVYYDGRVGLQNDAVYISSGNVGIGTTAPAAKLTIDSGNLLFTTNGNSEIYGLRNGVNQDTRIIINNQSTGGLHLGAKYGNPSGCIYFECGLGAYTERMRLTPNGNLLIGTTSDTARLNIVGSGSTSATTSLLVQNSGGNNALKVRDDGKTAFGNSTVDCTITGTAGSGNKFEFYAFNGYDIIDGFGNVLVTGLGDTIRLPRRVGIGFNTQNHASAVLQADSTTQGFLPPRMTTAQRTAIVSPAAGLIVYDTDTNKSYTYDGTAWQAHW